MDCPCVGQFAFQFVTFPLSFIVDHYYYISRGATRDDQPEISKLAQETTSQPAFKQKSE